MSSTALDAILATADNALRAVFGVHHAARPRPLPAAGSVDDTPLQESERRLSAALMRVNHVGEVCAQALYTGQALVTRDAGLKAHFEAAAREETDHLAWTQQRLQELGDRPSLLNPLWYGGALGIGLLAGRLGDRVSLGFVVETERQVEQHLESHLERLPAQDQASRAIVEHMKQDEARHATQAEEAGAMRLPWPVRMTMRAAAKVMTTTAHYI
ncbi:2-polyprenyl-3-methyl-6-methoxy-1,4-benzoquinone monooxygenase [Caldimonas brevitalea]|nr:2-polyprenyl-3-methyl-6-methoxy-1,4-benzoquinone monooxygenase [Caldimonas brevitalea]